MFCWILFHYCILTPFFSFFITCTGKIGHLTAIIQQPKRRELGKLFKLHKLPQYALPFYNTLMRTWKAVYIWYLVSRDAKISETHGGSNGQVLKMINFFWKAETVDFKASNYDCQANELWQAAFELQKLCTKRFQYLKLLGNLRTNLAIPLYENEQNKWNLKSRKPFVSILNVR